MKLVKYKKMYGYSPFCENILNFYSNYYDSSIQFYCEYNNGAAHYIRGLLLFIKSLGSSYI